MYYFIFLLDKFNLIFTWLNGNQGAVLAILTLIYVVATILIFRANSNSVREMKNTREAENRPYIIIYTESRGNGVVNLIVKNIGKTLATDIKLSSYPEIMFPKSRPLHKSNLFQKLIPNMAPNFQYKGFLGMGWDLKDENNKFPVYKIVTTYCDNNAKEYKEEYILDLNTDSDLLYIVERDLSDLAKDFKEYKSKHNKEMSALNSNLETLISSHSLQSRHRKVRNVGRKRKNIDSF